VAGVVGAGAGYKGVPCNGAHWRSRGSLAARVRCTLALAGFTSSARPVLEVAFPYRSDLLPAFPYRSALLPAFPVPAPVVVRTARPIILTPCPYDPIKPVVVRTARPIELSCQPVMMAHARRDA
jgi:hypothetical protein